MAAFRPPHVDQDPDAIFECPCGYQGKWEQVLGHRPRKDKKKLHPECAGKIVSLGQREPEPYRPEAVEISTEVPPELENDPEKIAALMVARRAAARGEAPPNTERAWWDVPPAEGGGGGSDDAGGGDGLDGLPPGDWAFAPGDGPISVSTHGVSLILPVQVRDWYDYAIRRGWKAGDSSLSAFVWDFLSCHWRVCMGKALVVVDREEVTLVAS